MSGSCELFEKTDEEKIFDEIASEPEQTIQPKKTLTDSYNWLQRKDWGNKSAPDVNYPAKYVLEASISDNYATAICNRLYNDYDIGWKESMKNASIVAKNASTNYTLSKPSWNTGYYDKNANNNWKKIKKHYNLSDRDKPFLYSMYDEETLLNGIIDENECSKSKLKNEDDCNVYMGPIKTKYDLYATLKKMVGTVCAKCQYYVENLNQILVDCNSQNYNNELSHVKAMFITDAPTQTDISTGLPFSDSTIGIQIRNYIANSGLKDDEYILVNSIGCCNSNADKCTQVFKCFDYIESIIDIIKSKNLTIFVCTNDIASPVAIRFGISSFDDTYNRYDNILTVPFDTSHIINNTQFDYIGYITSVMNRTKSPKVSKECRRLKMDVYNNLKNAINAGVPLKPIANANIFDMTPVSGLISTTNNNYNKEPVIEDFDSFINNLDTGWTYITSSMRSIPKIKRDGTISTSSRGIPYIVMRKGGNKILKYIDPKVTLYYTNRLDFKTAEKMDSLEHTEPTPYTQLNFSIYNNRNVACWYNADFPISVYITDILRNKHKYEEGDDSPRIWYFDIEAEMDTVKVKIDDETIDGRIRLFTIFDSYEKVFYCAVRKEKVNRDQKISYISFYEETKDKKGNPIKSGPYPVITKEFEDERDLFKHFNLLLEEKDPDIITGWNSEMYDMPFMYVRGNTLGVPIHNKYSAFRKSHINTKMESKTIVACDGLIFMDYRVLYKLMQQNKKENYKLDFICSEELGPYRKKNDIEISHDFMYENRLQTYLEYNVIDVFRIYELENTLSYFKYQSEVIKICNIGWDDIYAKTKMIDGLVFNHVLKDGYVLKTKNRVEEVVDNDTGKKSTKVNGKFIDGSYGGATVLDSQPGVYEEAADLDLTSLYPSIMIRYNLLKDCLVAYINSDIAEQWLYDRDSIVYPFVINIYNNGGIQPAQVECKEIFEEYIKDKIITMHGTIYWKPQVKRSFISDILIYLMDQRGVYKKKKNKALSDNNPELYGRYDVIQMAYKQLTNSFYGVMGLLSYRLSDISTASSITASGREITKIGSYYVSKYLEKMVELGTSDIPYESIPIEVKSLDHLEEAENRQYVIYGDTDSLFINVGKVVKTLLGPDSTSETRINYTWDIICRTADYINKYVIHQLLLRKGIDPTDEYSKYNFNYKTEFVMKKALFLDIKKNYACKLALENGTPVDPNDSKSIDIKGLAPKKSSYARAGRNCSWDIIKYILEDYDLNNSKDSNNSIMKIISEYEANCTSMCLKGDSNIGTPVSMGGDLKGYQVIAAHIRGMLIYDVLFDHEYRLFEKGYAYPITNINWDRVGISKDDFLEKFKERYSKYKWYNNLTKKSTTKKSTELNLDTIVIPMEANEGQLNVDLFDINIDKIKETCIYNRIENIVNVVGITAITPKQKMEELKHKDDIIL